MQKNRDKKEINFSFSPGLSLSIPSYLDIFHANINFSAVFLFLICWFFISNSAIVLERSISASSDDAAENVSDGSVNLTDDIDLVYDATLTFDEVVGLRFTNITIPNGAIITYAHIQFYSDDASPGDANSKMVVIKGEAIDNSSTFTTSTNDISSRTTTSASNTWDMPTWASAMQDAGQRTVNIQGVVQEIIDRVGWISGNALSIIISSSTGTGYRVAESYDSYSGREPKIHIEYTIAPNLSQGKTINVSSQETGKEGIYAVDGNSTTRWQTNYLSDPDPDSGWIYIDLGNIYSVDSVYLNWENAAAQEYYIQGSNSATIFDNSWTDVAHITDGISGQVRNITFPPVYTQYVRMRGISRTTSYGYSLYEFEVYEGPATPVKDVFYSVGPATMNLAIGPPSVTISSGVATFSAAQPDTVGVGDEISYGNNKRAYISGRTDNSHFYVTTAIGTVPLDVTSASVNYIKRAYNTLANAVNGAPDNTHLGTYNLVNANVRLHFACYKDGSSLTGNVTIDGWTTSDTTFIRIFAPASPNEVGISQRHKGKAGTGFALSNSSGHVIQNNANYTVIEGIEVHNTGATGAGIVADMSGFLQGVVIKNCVIHGSEYGIMVNNTSTDAVMQNIIAYGTSSYTIYGPGGSSSAKLYNSSILGPSSNYGVYGVLAQNVICCTQGGYCFTQMVISGSDYNVSTDNTAPGGNSLTNALISDQFVSVTSGLEDLHLTPYSDAIDAGTDMSGSFPDDIDGANRTGTWDIGADEFQDIPKVWDGGGADNNWFTAANWNPDGVPSSYDSVVFDAGTKGCILNDNDTVRAINFDPSFSGYFDFASDTLDIMGNADFSSGGDFANPGLLRFIGSFDRSLTPPSGDTLPKIYLAGSGTTTISTNDLHADSVYIYNGTLDVSTNSFITEKGITIESATSLDASNGSMDINGNLNVFGNLTAPSTGSFTVGGSFQINGAGTFNNSSGTVTLDGTNNYSSVYSNYQEFYNLDLKRGGLVTTFQDSITVTNTFSCTTSVCTLKVAGGTGQYWNTTYLDGKTDYIYLKSTNATYWRLFINSMVDTFEYVDVDYSDASSSPLQPVASLLTSRNWGIVMGWRFWAPAPTITTANDTTHKWYPDISWDPIPEMTSQDSFFVHIDTINGMWGWQLDNHYYYDVSSASISYIEDMRAAGEGFYKYMISTSWDSAGYKYSMENVSIDSLVIDVPAPVITTLDDTSHRQTAQISWDPIPEMTSQDSFFVHIDTINGMWGWQLDSWYDYNVTSGALGYIDTYDYGEGKYKYMVSTSLDSAGFRNWENAAVDSVVIDFPTPVITTSYDTTKSWVPEISWDPVPDFTAQDSFFVHVDTVTGFWGWKLDNWYDYNSTSGTLNYMNTNNKGEGKYKYMLSTSSDSAGFHSSLNTDIDTVVINIPAPTITTSYDTTEDNNPTITWGALSGMTSSDSFYVHIDTITKALGWQLLYSIDYSTYGADISLANKGVYIYMVSTSWDSAGLHNMENVGLDTIAFIDTTAPTNVGCSSPADASGGLPLAPTLSALTASDGTGEGLNASPYYFELAQDNGFSTGLQSSGWIPSNTWVPSALSSGTTYYWRVKARDVSGNESSQCGASADVGGYSSFTTNYTPSSISITIQTINEGLAVGTDVGTFSTTDGDGSDTHTYTLVTGTGSTDNASFTIDGVSLKTGAVFDYETKSGYAVRVRTTDSGADNLWFEQAFTITVNDLNDAPSDIILSSSGIDENQAAGTTAGTFSTTDQDAGNTHTYSLVTGTGSTDNASFSISGTSLNTSAVFNYETKSSYSIRVRTIDSGTGNLTFEKAFTVTVNDMNDAPVDIAVSSQTVNENRAAGTTVGTLSSVDPDAGSTHTYSLVTGTGDADNASFSISGTMLQTAAAFDFETKSSYSIRVRTTDDGAGSLTFEKTLTISVGNVNEAPSDITLSVSSVEENQASGTTVGTLSSIDQDAGDTHAYSLVAGTGSTDNASFSISGNSLITNAVFDYETQAGYSIRLQSSDNGGLIFQKEFSVTVNNVNEVPISNDDSYSSGEDAVLSVPSPGILSNDADADGDAITAVLVTGVPSSQGTLSLQPDGSFDFTPVDNFNGAVTFTYRASDGQLNSAAAATVTITVGTGNDVPVASNDSYAVDEDSVLIIAAPGILSNDSDIDNDALTAILVSNPSSGSLSLNSDGSLSYTPQADFNGDVSFTYSAYDGALNSSVTTVTITVNPVNDAPVSNADSFSVSEDSVLTISEPGVLGNDIDAENNTITASPVTSTHNGTLSFNANGSFTYVPAADFSGIDTFTYNASDGSRVSDPAKVTINVLPANDAPTGISLSEASIDEGLPAGSAVGVLSTDDIDADDSHTYSVLSGAGDTLFSTSGDTLKTAGVLYFNEAAAYSIRIRSTDAGGLFFENDFNLSVNNVLPPENNLDVSMQSVGDSAVDISFGMPAGIAPDAEMTSIYFRHGGAVTDIADTTVRSLGNFPIEDLSFTVETKKQGWWFFAYDISDNAGNRSEPSNDSILIINTPPHFALPDTLIISEDVQWSYTLAATDLNGDSIVFSPAAMPSGASIDGSFRIISWTPVNGDVGAHKLIIGCDDGYGQTTADSSVIIVKNVNDPPAILSAYIPDSVQENSQVAGTVVVGDIDPGDTIAVTWDRALIWLGTANKSRDSSGTAWIVEIDGFASDRHIGWNRYTLKFTDKSGASVSIDDSIYVINTNDPPQTSVSARNIQWGAAQYTVRGTDDFDTVLTYHTTLIYNNGDTIASIDTVYNKFNFYPLCDGDYLFLCYAEDSKGLIDSTPAVETFSVSGATSHTVAWPESVWHMISVPSKPAPADPLKTDAYLLHWDESGVEDPIFKYYIQPQDIDSTEPGLSYWRDGNDTAALSVNTEDLIDAPVSIELVRTRYGWNQIATPYPYLTAWKGEEVLWRWNPQTGDYEEQENQTLEPWQGYWVLADTTRSITLDNKPVFQSATLAKRAKTLYNNRNEWRIQVKLVSECGMDADNIIGFSPDARDGLDRMDRPEPPRMTGQRYLFFPHDDWKHPVSEFASDIRKQYRDLNVFQLGISPSGRFADRSSFSFEGINSLQDVYLYLAVPGGIQSVEEDSLYDAGASDRLMYKTLFVTSDANFLRNYPMNFMVNAPFPNPFNLRVNIRYTLPYRWADNGLLNSNPYMVSIRIYDALGRMVRELVNRKQIPGTYKTMWDGKSNTGRMVGSGAYFCRITAGKYSEIKQMIMLK